VCSILGGILLPSVFQLSVCSATSDVRFGSLADIATKLVRCPLLSRKQTFREAGCGYAVNRAPTLLGELVSMTSAPTAALRTRRRAGAKVFGGASSLTGTRSLDWLLLVSFQRCF
jgi:hypothetical protein